jgi:hypothetical protein
VRRWKAVARTQSWVQKRESPHGWALLTLSGAKAIWEAHGDDGSVGEVTVAKEPFF